MFHCNTILLTCQDCAVTVLYLSLLQKEQPFHGGQQNQKGKIERRKQSDVSARPLFVVGDVLTESDETGKRRNERTHPADIHPDQQRAVIARKLCQQNSAGDVADDLTGQHGHQQGVLLHQPTEKVFHPVYPCHIARKDEKGDEGQKQSVIHLCQRFSVHKQQTQRHDDQPYPERHHVKYNDDGQDKQHAVDNRPCHGQSDFFSCHFQRLLFDKQQTTRSNGGNGNAKRGEHGQEKLSRRDGKTGIQVQVLRIAEGGQHTTEIGGDVLHDKSKRHIFLLARRRKDEISERQKGKQRHIVGNQHGPQKGDVDECQHGRARIFEHGHDLLGKQGKETDVSERADHRQRTKQAGERLKIEIFEILRIGRHDKSRHGGGKRRHAKHDVFDKKRPDLMYEFTDDFTQPVMSVPFDCRMHILPFLYNDRNIL